MFTRDDFWVAAYMFFALIADLKAAITGNKWAWVGVAFFLLLAAATAFKPKRG